MQLPTKISRDDIRMWLELPVTKTIYAAIAHRKNELKKDFRKTSESLIDVKDLHKASRELACLQGMYKILEDEILHKDYLKVITNDIRALSPPLQENE